MQATIRLCMTLSSHFWINSAVSHLTPSIGNQVLYNGEPQVKDHVLSKKHWRNVKTRHIYAVYFNLNIKLHRIKLKIDYVHQIKIIFEFVKIHFRAKLF